MKMNKVRKSFIIIILIILVILLTFMIRGVLFSSRPSQKNDNKGNQEESLELIGESKEPLEIPTELTTGQILPKESNYRLENLVIGNIRAYVIENEFGCAVNADVENISDITYEDYPITIILYDEQDQELVRFESTITLLPTETTTIAQYYIDEEHNNILNFTKYMIIGS